MKMIRIARWASVWLLALAACKPAGPASPFDTLDAEATALRTAFNADAGTVRVLLLVAPT